jgi:manganese/zinc/iron transport system permease protein
MEHLITPELEAQLEAALGYPERDPHDRDIPR